MAIWYKNIFAESTKRPKCVVVDFDGTIARDKYPDIGSPMPSVKESLQKILDAGYEVVIFSARLHKNDGRPAGTPKEQKNKMEAWLKEHEIPYTRIDDGYDGKPHCDFIVDNKALHYGGDDDWESVTKFILSKGK